MCLEKTALGERAARTLPIACPDCRNSKPAEILPPRSKEPYHAME